MICIHVPLVRHLWDVCVCVCYSSCMPFTYLMCVCIYVCVFEFVCVYKLTHAFDSSVIQVVAEGTFTTEGAVRVDAGAVFTGVIHTLIHIWEKEQGVSYRTTFSEPKVQLEVNFHIHFIFILHFVTTVFLHSIHISLLHSNSVSNFNHLNGKFDLALLLAVLVSIHVCVLCSLL